MLSDRARNLAVVAALGLMLTGLTYIFFEETPDQLFSAPYLLGNVALVFLFLGTLFVAVLYAEDHWFELVGVGLLIFAATSIALFAVTESVVRLLALFCVFALVGASLSWGIMNKLSTLRGYQLTAILLTLVFGFAAVYLVSSLVMTGDFQFVTLLLVYTAIFGATVAGLRSELSGTGSRAPPFQ